MWNERRSHGMNIYRDCKREKTIAFIGLFELLFKGCMRRMVLRFRGASFLQKELLAREPAFLENDWYLGALGSLKSVY
jgi:hypothetical protein